LGGGTLLQASQPPLVLCTYSVELADEVNMPVLSGTWGPVRDCCCSVQWNQGILETRIEPLRETKHKQCSKGASNDKDELVRIAK
jgi:hypothetical protein